MSYHLAVAELLEWAARKRPEKGAVFDGSKRISYGELYKDVQLLASSLAAQGIEKGDRIIVYMPNWHEFVTVYFAVAKLGAIMVPANKVPPRGTAIYSGAFRGKSRFRRQRLFPF